MGPPTLTFHTYNGRTQGLNEWAQEYGIDAGTLYHRVVVAGWSMKEALTMLPGSKMGRQSRMLTHDGRTQSLVAWAAELGIPRKILSSRITNGWTVQEAFTIPPRRRRDKHVKLYTHDKRTQTLTEWAAELGIDRSTLYHRIEVYGWTVQEAFTIPPNNRRCPYGPRKK